jgi:Transposase domain (DUF772)
MTRFSAVGPQATGRPAYHPATLLKIYVYGYLNRVQSSRRLERECPRNIELVWLTGRLMPDFKTIADFRKDNSAAIRKVGRQFLVCAGALSCSARRALRSTAASSKLLTRGTGTLRRPRCSGGWSRSTRALPGTSHSRQRDGTRRAYLENVG